MKITKVTVKRINAHSNCTKADYIPAVYAIGEILRKADFLFGESGCYELNTGDDLVQPIILSDGDREYISGTVNDDYEKRVLRGIYTLYPKWISCTFTHGLNGVNLYEVNKLVKAIVEA